MINWQHYSTSWHLQIEDICAVLLIRKSLFWEIHHFVTIFNDAQHTPTAQHGYKLTRIHFQCTFLMAEFYFVGSLNVSFLLLNIPGHLYISCFYKPRLRFSLIIWNASAIKARIVLKAKQSLKYVNIDDLSIFSHSHLFLHM